MMNLTLLPSGHETATAPGAGNTTVLTCDHGASECAGNAWEQCGIASYPRAQQHFPWFACLERAAAGAASPDWAAAAEACANSAGLDFAPISACYADPARRQALALAYIARNPPQLKTEGYVPLVVVGGAVVPLGHDPGHLNAAMLPMLCEAWVKGGGTPPDACKNATATLAWS
jgi:hypothetical protein